ncbi:methyltransferase domain-containing protein [bacterium]|nr:methyltransferase domain-containing protein [bacterium]
MPSKSIKTLVRELIERSDSGYRFLLRRRTGARGPFGTPQAPWPCAVLKSQRQVDEAMDQVRRLGLPPLSIDAKNWDSLAALHAILAETKPADPIFDAGGDWNSVILPWLALYGYEDLVMGNLEFEGEHKRGPITFEYADLTATKHPDDHFAAATCLSVIEHGVPLEAYFREMARIIRRGGLLITSTDYFETPMDTHGARAYGAPVHVFSRAEIEAALRLADSFGFELVAPLELDSPEAVVAWPEHGLRYTFIVFTLRKR